jgi:hypothetical protein
MNWILTPGYRSDAAGDSTIRRSSPRLCPGGDHLTLFAVDFFPSTGRRSAVCKHYSSKKESKMNTKRVLGLSVVIAVVLIGSVSAPAVAQDNDNMEILREKLRADKKLIVAQNMQLSDAESKTFWPVYNAYQEEKSKLADRLRQVIQDYAANFQTLSDKVAKDLVDRSLAIKQDDVKLMAAYLPKFRQAVGDKKAARFYQIENKIDAIVNFELAANIPLAQ